MARISKEAKEKVRLALLATAARHFAREGLAGANINDISTDAGFARGTVYNYFTSKEALFGAVLRAGTDLAVARARARGLSSGQSARQTLLLLAEEDVRLARRNQAFVKVMLKELLSPHRATRQHLEAATLPLREAVREALEAGQTVGEVTDRHDANELATLFLGQLTMLYVEHWSSGGAFPTWEKLPLVLVEGFFDGFRGAHAGAAVSAAR